MSTIPLQFHYVQGQGQRRYVLRTFVEALMEVILGLLLVLSLGGRSMMCGMLGVGDGVLGQMFALEAIS